MNDYQKSIDWPHGTKLVQGISYKRRIQILLSACIQLFFQIYESCPPPKKKADCSAKQFFRKLSQCRCTFRQGKFYSLFIALSGTKIETKKEKESITELETSNTLAYFGQAVKYSNKRFTTLFINILRPYPNKLDKPKGLKLQ